jgi:hypothetical protein
MVTVVRLGRVLLILALAFIAISFVMGIGTPSTGLPEKAVLLVLFVGCVLAAAKLTSIGERIIHHIER